MPSDTWWWVGLGTAAAATVAGGVMIYRHRGAASGPVLGPPEGAPSPTPSPDPVPPVPEPDPTQDFGFGAPDPLISEICRQWKVGQDAPDWRPELVAIYRNVIQQLIAERQPIWTNYAQFIEHRFLITRAALARICPNVRLPSRRSMVQVLKRQEGFYWEGLWDRLRAAVNQQLLDYGN